MQFNGHSAIDPTKAFYRGDSQGGIFGTTYMALTTDVTYGMLGEPGTPYSLLLSRSEDFSGFSGILHIVYKDPRDTQIAISLLQLMWDRTEPDGYVLSSRKTCFRTRRSIKCSSRSASATTKSRRSARTSSRGRSARRTSRR